MNIDNYGFSIRETMFLNQISIKANFDYTLRTREIVKIPVYVPDYDTAIFTHKDNKSLDLDLVTKLCKDGLLVVNVKETEEQVKLFEKLVEDGFTKRVIGLEMYYPESIKNNARRIRTHLSVKQIEEKFSDKELIRRAKESYPEDSKVLKEIVDYYTPDQSGFSQADRDRVKKDFEKRKRYLIKEEGYEKDELDSLSNDQILNLYQRCISARQLEPQDDIDGDFDERSADNA